MPDSNRARRALSRARRVVVKIGSKALSQDIGSRSGSSRSRRGTMFHKLADDVAQLRDSKKRVIIVSSGAIALGMGRLDMARRPRAMPALQAAAAAGQGLLMQRYGDAFDRHELRVAQVLLTHADLANRARANNARASLAKLIELGVVPIINENDAVAVDEIRFGDNDELAAMVAPLCDADLLILLSHVDGLLDDDGGRVPLVTSRDDVMGYVTSDASEQGRGGMGSKLEAARRATLAGASVVIAAATEPRVLSRILAGEDVGTLFPAQQQRMATRKHWIAYTLRPRGVAVVDDGAAEAIRKKGRSILCVGVVGVRGDFVSGDPIAIVDAHGVEIARGLARLSAMEAARLAMRPKPKNAASPKNGEPNGDKPHLLVHRDDLVVLPQS